MKCPHCEYEDQKWDDKKANYFTPEPEVGDFYQLPINVERRNEDRYYGG
jgi:hypothetical protein